MHSKKKQVYADGSYGIAVKERQSNILKQLDGVEREIAKIRKQAFYRNGIKDTCLLQAYTDGDSSLILNLVSKWKADTVSPMHSLCRYGETRVQFTVCISFGDANDMPDRVEAEKQKMFVGNINIVKRPDNRILPSIVRLNFVHDEVEQWFTPGVYLNPVKGILDFVPFIPNWEFGFIGELVGEQPSNGAAPRVVQSSPHIVQSIASNQGQVFQSRHGIRDFVYQNLSTVSVILDCGSASVFERNDGSCKVRDMFLGPLNLESGVSIKCSHAAEEVSTLALTVNRRVPA